MKVLMHGDELSLRELAPFLREKFPEYRQTNELYSLLDTHIHSIQRMLWHVQSTRLVDLYCTASHRFLTSTKEIVHFMFPAKANIPLDSTDEPRFLERLQERMYDQSFPEQTTTWLDKEEIREGNDTFSRIWISPKRLISLPQGIIMSIDAYQIK
jgi:hypothetical protein